MAIKTITYLDKAALNENSDIADINKCNASDLNEIKNVVNNNANETSNNTTGIENILNAEVYSTNEVKTNKVYVDGNNVEHHIYRKTINIGYLGNSSTVSVNHNISNLGRFIDIRGNAVREVDKDTLSIPYVTFNPNNGGGIIFYANETKIYVTTSTNRSSYVGILTLEYTKTTE